jgi:hypothetical protein
MSEDPSSNLWALLDGINVQTDQTVRTIGSLLGALADVSGAVGIVGAVGSIVDVVSTALGKGEPDEFKSGIAQITQLILKSYHQLGLDLGANQIMHRNTVTWDKVEPARQSLKDLTLVNLPLTDTDFLTYIRPCLDALDYLSNPLQPDEVWNLDFDWQAYWTDKDLFYTVFNAFYTDCGYGDLLPPRNADGLTVFSYAAALPMFMLATTCLVAVAGYLDPRFPANPTYANAISDAANLLQDRHDRVSSQIATLIPEPFTTRTITGQSFQDVKGLRSFGEDNPPRYPNDRGAMVEYGAVERFSGRSIIENSYPVGLGASGIENDDPGPYNKLRIRALSKSKRIYNAVGLDAVWQSINSLRRLGHQDELSGPNYGQWSIMQEVVPLTGISQPADLVTSLSAVASFLMNTLPGEFAEPIPNAPVPLPPGAQVPIETPHGRLYSLKALLDGPSWPPISVLAGHFAP